MDIYVFGYGSLINTLSAERTLKREISTNEMYACSLGDYSRRWNLKDSVYSGQLGKQVYAAFLNIEYSRNSGINGKIFKVSEDELNNLTARERNYDLAEVSGKIDQIDGPAISIGSKVYTFVGKKEFLVTAQDTDVYVFEDYINIINEGLNQSTYRFKEMFFQTTQEIETPVLEGNYVFK